MELSPALYRCALAVALVCSHETLARAQGTALDARLYGLALDSLFAEPWREGDSLLIASETMASPFRDGPLRRVVSDSIWRRTVRRYLPGLQPSTELLLDPQERPPKSIPRAIESRRAYRFISSDSMDLVPDWAKGARYSVSLSEVQYSRDGSQALVYVVHACPLCGWGALVLLARDSANVWRVSATLQVWFS